MKRLRGAMIGYGFISRQGHLPTQLNRAQECGDVEIIAIGEPFEERFSFVGEVRGIGLLLAIEFVKKILQRNPCQLSFANPFSRSA